MRRNDDRPHASSAPCGRFGVECRVVRDQVIEVRTDRLVGRVAEQSLGGRVPERDLDVPVHHDDRRGARLDEGLEEPALADELADVLVEGERARRARRRSSIGTDRIATSTSDPSFLARRVTSSVGPSRTRSFSAAASSRIASCWRDEVVDVAPDRLRPGPPEQPLGSGVPLRDREGRIARHDRRRADLHEGLVEAALSVGSFPCEDIEAKRRATAAPEPRGQSNGAGGYAARRWLRCRSCPGPTPLPRSLSEAGCPEERVRWLTDLGLHHLRRAGPVHVGRRARGQDGVRALGVRCPRGDRSSARRPKGCSSSSGPTSTSRTSRVRRSERTFAEFQASAGPRAALLPAVYEVLGLPEARPRRADPRRRGGAVRTLPRRMGADAGRGLDDPSGQVDGAGDAGGDARVDGAAGRAARGTRTRATPGRRAAGVPRRRAGLMRLRASTSTSRSSSVPSRTATA